jgi:hypothetical protein
MSNDTESRNLSPVTVQQVQLPLSPPPLVVTTASTAIVSNELSAADSNSNSQLSPPSLPAPPPVAVDDAAALNLKRTQSIQEMREKERRKREELAGNKIDMTEQHKLIAQFEKNLMPPS